MINEPFLSAVTGRGWRGAPGPGDGVQDAGSGVTRIRKAFRLRMGFPSALSFEIKVVAPHRGKTGV